MPVDELPNYNAVEVDNDANAILPRDFLLNIMDNLPDKWYHHTYPYYPFFDPSQRDTLGRVIIESNVVDALPVNMNKWRECAKMLGNQTFKDTGKLEYGYEIGRMAMSDGYTCEGKKEEINTNTTTL